MNSKFARLYLVAGITGVLSGILMLISGYLVIFRLRGAYFGTPDEQLEFVATQPLAGIVHGLSVASLILIVPTIITLLALFGGTATARGFLGAGFAVFWIVIGLVEHLCQTAPLRSLGELYSDLATREMALSIYHVSEGFWEALSLTATFFCVLMCLCCGLALIPRRNRLSGYVFLIAIVAFPIGLMARSVGIQLHVILRGVAFILFSGVLIQAAREE